MLQLQGNLFSIYHRCKNNFIDYHIEIILSKMTKKFLNSEHKQKINPLLYILKAHITPLNLFQLFYISIKND